MSHSLNAYVTKRENFPSDLEKIIPFVKTSQDCIIFMDPVKAPEPFETYLKRIGTYADIMTDYFGGVGDQTARMYRDGELEMTADHQQGCINQALRLLGFVSSDSDEFDAINLGRYRSNKDILIEWKSKSGIKETPVSQEEKLDEMNKAFALYEGAMEKDDLFIFPDGRQCKMSSPKNSFSGADRIVPLMQYHHSWNWIIPIMKKISEKESVTVGKLFELMNAASIECTPEETQKFLYNKYFKHED